jgi:hypothetical protein
VRYGFHTIRLTMCGITVWFSYQTPVAFRVGVGKITIRTNNWGPTTGKHLNWIVKDVAADNYEWVSGGEFEERWKKEVGVAHV